LSQALDTEISIDIFPYKFYISKLVTKLSIHSSGELS